MFGIQRHILRSSPVALVPLLCMAGATIMLFFCLLSGVMQHNPLNRVFFLQADTSDIPGAPPLTHFTLNNACDQQNGINYACRGRHAASPMLPQRFFGTTSGVPQPFLRHPDMFFYLSRFTYAFYIITIFFALLALLLDLAALLSTVATLTAAIMTGVALLSCTFLACVMTAVYVQAQNAFRGVGKFARVGVKAFAFTWVSFVLLLVSFITLLALWKHRYRWEGRLKKLKRVKRKKGESIMTSILGRRRRIRKSIDTFSSISGSNPSRQGSYGRMDIDRDVNPPPEFYERYTDPQDTYERDTYPQYIYERDTYPQDTYERHTYPRDTYTSHSSTAVGRDDTGVMTHNFAADYGDRRFAETVADDYITPRARDKYTPYIPRVGTTPTIMSPVHLNK